MTANQPTAAMFDDPEQIRRFPPQVPNERRVNFGRVRLHALEKPTDRFFHIEGALRCQPAEIRLYFVEFVFQHRFHERRLARKAGIEGLLAHSQLGGEIVHADSSEAVDEKLPPGRGDHVPYDDRSACPLVSSRALDMHGNTMETIVVLQVSI